MGAGISIYYDKATEINKAPVPDLETYISQNKVFYVGNGGDPNDLEGLRTLSDKRKASSKILALAKTKPNFYDTVEGVEGEEDSVDTGFESLEGGAFDDQSLYTDSEWQMIVMLSDPNSTDTEGTFTPYGDRTDEFIVDWRSDDTGPDLRRNARVAINDAKIITVGARWTPKDKEDVVHARSALVAKGGYIKEAYDYDDEGDGEYTICMIEADELIRKLDITEQNDTLAGKLALIFKKYQDQTSN